MFLKKRKNYSEEEIKELHKKAECVKQKIANPHTIRLHDKLKALLNAKADSRDNFINWITGLTTGAILLMLNMLSSGIKNKELAVLSVIILFLTIVFAMLFKIFLEVRYSNEELEVSLLKNLYKGHDLQQYIADSLKQGKQISEEEKQKLCRNLEESLNYFDEDYQTKFKKPITIKSICLTWSYKLTILFFFAGITLMVAYFILTIQ